MQRSKKGLPKDSPLAKGRRKFEIGVVLARQMEMEEAVVQGTWLAGMTASI
jgi:hypothetical protein